MLSCPRVGQRVMIWYKKKFAHLWPLHGKTGTVLAAGRGRPRNHLIDVDGVRVVVPGGNLEAVTMEAKPEPVVTHTFAIRRKRWAPYRHAAYWDGERWQTACGRTVDERRGTLTHYPESRVDCGDCRRNLTPPAPPPAG